MSRALTPPRGWRPSYREGEKLGVLLNERLASRDRGDSSDARLWSQTLVEEIADAGWEVYVIGESVRIRPIAAPAAETFPGFSDPSFMQGLVDVLAPRLRLFFDPFPCPRCGVVRALLEDLPCSACLEVSSDG